MDRSSSQTVTTSSVKMVRCPRRAGPETSEGQEEETGMKLSHEILLYHVDRCLETPAFIATRSTLDRGFITLQSQPIGTF